MRAILITVGLALLTLIIAFLNNLFSAHPRIVALFQRYFWVVVGLFILCVVAFISLTVLDQKQQNARDNGATSSAGLVSPVQAIPTNTPCPLAVQNISLGKSIIEVNQSTDVSVTIDNPDGKPVLYDWKANNGSMNPDIRTRSAQSTYTALGTPNDDTIMVDVTVPGCPTITRSRIIRVVAANAVATAPAAPTSEPPTPKEDRYDVKVDPSKYPFVSTDINISEGDEVEVNIQGSDTTWQCGDDKPVGIEGVADQDKQNFSIMRTVNFCSLIGYIGNGAPFSVPNKKPFEASSSGKLFLGPNDASLDKCQLPNPNECFSDNSGKLFFKIIVRRKQGAAQNNTAAKVHIVSPKNGDAVSRSTTVSGTYENISGDTIIWVYTRANVRGRYKYYPDKGEKITQNSWEAKIRVSYTKRGAKSTHTYSEPTSEVN